MFYLSSLTQSPILFVHSHSLLIISSSFFPITFECIVWCICICMSVVLWHCNSIKYFYSFLPIGNIQHMFCVYIGAGTLICWCLCNVFAFTSCSEFLCLVAMQFSIQCLWTVKLSQRIPFVSVCLCMCVWFCLRASEFLCSNISLSLCMQTYAFENVINRSDTTPFDILTMLLNANPPQFNRFSRKKRTTANQFQH